MSAGGGGGGGRGIALFFAYNRGFPLFIFLRENQKCALSLF